MKQVIEKLEAGKRYTLFAINDFGYPYSLQITMESAKVDRYAQYPEAVHLVFKPKGKRNLRGVIYTPIQRFALWDGWIDVEDNMWGPSQMGNTQGVTVKRAKYGCFDNQYFTDGLASAPEPLVKFEGRYGA